jgi:hypothetical protein
MPVSDFVQAYFERSGQMDRDAQQEKILRMQLAQQQADRDQRAAQFAEQIRMQEQQLRQSQAAQAEAARRAQADETMKLLGLKAQGVVRDAKVTPNPTPSMELLFPDRIREPGAMQFAGQWVRATTPEEQSAFEIQQETRKRQAALDARRGEIDKFLTANPNLPPHVKTAVQASLFGVSLPADSTDGYITELLRRREDPTTPPAELAQINANLKFFEQLKAMPQMYNPAGARLGWEQTIAKTQSELQQAAYQIAKDTLKREPSQNEIFQFAQTLAGMFPKDTYGPALEELRKSLIEPNKEPKSFLWELLKKDMDTQKVGQTPTGQ